jgi:DNA-binding transcriptional MerR regulator
MRISEIARAAGVGVKTVRYYERSGLLPEPARTSSGYRCYGDDDLARLRFIRRAKTLGFQLREIGELLALRDGEDVCCAEVAGRARAKAASLERQIHELESCRSVLVGLARSCAAQQESGTCALLSHLAGEDEPITAAPVTL